MSTELTISDPLSRLLESHFDVACAFAVGRAALGLREVLRCWKDRQGECRVAMPGAVCHEVLLAVLAAGAEPFFCDVDFTTGLVTGSEWARARAAGANVALVVHLYGNPADTPFVSSLFRDTQCLVVDDAAQALGSVVSGRQAGSLGDVGLLSFGATKQISLGNAALVFRDAGFAGEVRARLANSATAGSELRARLSSEFRERLEKARATLRLAEAGHSTAPAGPAQSLPRAQLPAGIQTSAIVGAEFAGLLNGLEPVLDVPLVANLAGSLVRALEDYESAASKRVHKAALWRRLLAGTGLEPIEAPGRVPWRYACRLPGIGWSEQHRIATDLRGRGLHVSNWYLPVHWFMREPQRALPGVERLSREVFQFWVDEATSESDIRAAAHTVRARLAA